MKSIFAFFILTIITISPTDDKNQTDEIIIPKKEIFTSIIDSSELKSDDYITGIKSQVKTREISEDVLNQSLLKNNNKSLKVQSTILFLDKEKENILGVGVYYYSNIKNDYYFELFKYSLSSNDFVKEFSMVSNFLFLKEIFYLKEKYFQNSNIDLLYAEGVKQLKTNSNYSDFSLKMKSESLDEISSKTDVSLNELTDGFGDNTVACGIVGNCLRGSGSCAAPSFVCMKPITCGKKAVEEKISSSNIENAKHYLKNVIIGEKYYNFRDNYLVKSKVGRKYVGLFYAVSQHFKQELDTKNLLLILETLPEINNSLDNLMNPDFKGIIISEKLKNNILNITNSFKNKTSSRTFKDIISKLEIDIDKISLKPKSEISEFLQK